MENEILPPELKGNRTLATVLFTDCVGFSARMSVNEEHTLNLIGRDLQVMNKICDTYEGRVLKSTGDGLLVCFSSAINAVECAIAIQQKMTEVMQTLPPSDTLMHRIGIHLADMYITSTDVMGNGVNIAARLQTEAEPGGICISKTVYDVAKNSLQLETEYLGPRELKNIREVVPVYRVLLDTTNLPNDPFGETLQILEQSENVNRIRKLIFYVCKNHWENDESKLTNLNLKGIIHEFLGLAPDYEQLRNLLSAAVSTLSKQAEYSLIVNEILNAAAKFYLPEQTLQRWQGQPLLIQNDADGSVSNDNNPRSQYEQVAQQIDRHPDALRLKKLLYYICRQQWESNPALLQAVSTAQLLEEVIGLANDIQQLKLLIDKFVQTLNKRVEYALVAATLVSLLGTLYGDDLAEVTTGSQPPPELVTVLKVSDNHSHASGTGQDQQHLMATIAAQIDQSPQGVRIKKLAVYLCRGQWLQDTSQLTSIDTISLLEELQRATPTEENLRQGLNTIVKNLSKPAEYTAIAQMLIQAMSLLYQASIVPLAPAVPQPISAAENKQNEPVRLAQVQIQAPVVMPASSLESPTVSPDRVNSSSDQAIMSMFDIRLGILKYTNPLKAKILAFSALYSNFEFNEQDWFNLKMYELDGLLRGLLRACRNYTDLENLLYMTARRLEQPDDLVQTAETIIKYLRTYYIHGNPSLLASFATPDETRISLDEFESATQQLANFTEDEQTIGFAPAPTQLREFRAPIVDSSPHTQLLSTQGQDLQSSE